MFKRNQKGFSLIEISVVILIIGILIAGISQASDMIDESNLKSARSASKGSRVSRTRDLVLWLDATADGTVLNSANKQVADNESVAQWKDSNPNSIDGFFLTGVAPQYNANKTSGLPSIFFSGSSYLKLSNKFDNFAGEYTIYLIYQPAVLSNSVIMEKRSTAQTGAYPYKLELDATNLVYKLSDSNGSISSSSTKKPSAGKINLIRLSRSTSGVLTISVDDVSASGVANATSVVNSSELMIGALNATTIANYINGRIGELIIFDRDLNPVEKSDIEKYLYKKWKLSK
jgi:prepilin-type N-terminal cleavage/methylation domain-containing protein